MHGRAAAFHHVLHASAEDAVHADDDLVAGLDQVHGDAFHSRHAGTAHGKGQRIFRLENLAQHFAGLVHDGQILRIEMTESGRRERAQHARETGLGPGPSRMRSTGNWVFMWSRNGLASPLKSDSAR